MASMQTYVWILCNGELCDVNLLQSVARRILSGMNPCRNDIPDAPARLDKINVVDGGRTGYIRTPPEPTDSTFTKSWNIDMPSSRLTKINGGDIVGETVAIEDWEIDMTVLLSLNQ